MTGRRLAVATSLGLLLVGGAGCREREHRGWTWGIGRTQRHAQPYDSTSVFANRAVLQPPPEGTVHAAAELDDDPAAGPDAPLPARPASGAALLARGADRFGVFCAPCHGAAGYGGSVVAMNLVPRPLTLRADSTRALDDEQLYRIVRDGVRRMPGYAAQLPPADRWAVVAYVRALQARGPRSAPERTDSVRAATMAARRPAAP